MSAQPPGEEHVVGPDAPQRPLIAHLEPDQLVQETLRPVPPAQLSRSSQAGLWALRVFAIAMGAMVIYAFVDSL
ncbi:MAG TPA: hypothetical protein VFW29_04020 [Solirubrobacteraceae bacterium]|nr:hypothetical protein [Solirubrobacteraceae bacterium]